MKNKISDSSFVIVANGYADGPAQPLRDYLISKHARQITTVFHPLVPEGDNKHIVTTYTGGAETTKITRLPNKPPYTYLFDPFVPFHLPRSTAWFGFNNLACLRGLMGRKLGTVEKVYYWAVDFVPERFGTNPATKAYNFVDRKVSINADARIELSEAALSGREKYLNLPAERAPGIIAPMGTWLDRTEKADANAWKKRRIVYMGHLVERQGVATLIRALAVLDQKKVKVTADIIGSGPMLDDLKKQAAGLQLKHVKFHGFVKEYEKVEKLLGAATIAVAPYVKDENNFTQFADPGKLKAYLGAGLPIVLTDVPPNAAELQKSGAGMIVEDSPEGLASGIEMLLDKSAWLAAHSAAEKYAGQFDWNLIMKNCLNQVGFD